MRSTMCSIDMPLETVPSLQRQNVTATMIRTRECRSSSICLIVLFTLATTIILLTRQSSGMSQMTLGSHKFGVFDEIFVIHLRDRTERWAEMEMLRTELGAHWDYIDGIRHTDTLVSRILLRVYLMRHSTESQEGSQIPGEKDKAVHPGGHGLVAPMQFSLEELFDVDAQSVALESEPRGSDLWELESSDPRSSDVIEPLLTPAGEDWDRQLLVGGVTDWYLKQHNTLDTIKSDRWLSRGMVACWLSHLRALRLAAAAPNSTVLLIEDDVDMEWNLQGILENEWSHLPANWDIVFLGHCWSNESYFPAVTGSAHIHPSLSPKCTHAYAVSQRGAIKLLRHLRSPHFAFSRAIDQAFSFLIKNQLINAYSFSPSVIVQTKKFGSDVWAGGGKGSGWKDGLENSAIDRIGKGVDDY